MKALRLKNISDLESANAFLDEEFLEELNRKFALAPKQAADLHRRVGRGVKLERVLSFQEERVVQKDWTIRWRNRWLQLTPANQKLALVNRKVTVCEQLDGTVVILFGQRELAWEELPERPVTVRPVQRPRPKTRGPKKPSADHPWRRSYKASATAATVTSSARKSKR